MTNNAKPTLLVTGASGHMGRRVLELLLEAQAGPIIAATRTPEKLEDFAKRGVTVRHADFDEPESLDAAFAGADRLLIISTDTVSLSGQRLAQHLNAVKAAEKAGANHVVYMSLTAPGPDSPVCLAPDHHGTETALTDSKLGWTVLRDNIYAETLLLTLNQAVKMGKLFAAAGDGKTAYVTREDCSRAAAAALASPFSGRRTLDITGPEALSQSDLASIATKLTGQPVTYVPLELEVLIQNMVAAGLPRPVAELYASFDTGIAQGRFSVVSSAFEELTGLKPMRIADFLAANKEALMQGSAVH